MSRNQTHAIGVIREYRQKFSNVVGDCAAADQPRA
jgi:hypothetical protein